MGNGKWKAVEGFAEVIKRRKLEGRGSWGSEDEEGRGVFLYERVIWRVEEGWDQDGSLAFFICIFNSSQ